MKIVIATVGNQDPISPNTGQPTAPLLICLDQRPKRVYLIPTAEREDAPSNTYKNARDTQREILNRLPGTSVEIMPLNISDPTDLNKVLPEMERILRDIEKATMNLPEPHFIVTPTSGTPQMRDAIIRKINSGLLPRAEAYDVVDPRYVPEGKSRIRKIELPPPEKRRPKVALFVDHENMRTTNTREFARALYEAARHQGKVKIACVGAANWSSGAEQHDYAEEGFRVLTFAPGKESADYGLLKEVSDTIEYRPDVDLFIIVTSDEQFSLHGFIQALAQGKKVSIWRKPFWELPPNWHQLKRTYPESFQVESIEAIFREIGREVFAWKGTGQKTEKKQRKKKKPEGGKTVKLETGCIASGTVKKIDKDKIVLDLDGKDGFLFPSEQLQGENYHVGQKLNVHILEVREGSVVVSRRDETPVKSLFQLKVPEISNGRIEIKAISRKVGDRTKVLLASTQQGLDPVKCCIGKKGKRIKNIRKKLNHEKIDIMPYSSNAKELILNALKLPVEVNIIHLDEENKKATIAIPKKRSSLANDKVNIELAEKLTGYHIEMVEQ